jgi:hypothetical protein
MHTSADDSPPATKVYIDMSTIARFTFGSLCIGRADKLLEVRYLKGCASIRPETALVVARPSTRKVVSAKTSVIFGATVSASEDVLFKRKGCAGTLFP